MNVLIVDDEQHVREAIKLLVDWDSLGMRRSWKRKTAKPRSK